MTRPAAKRAPRARGRKKTPLDQALLKMEELRKLIPPSWLYMFQHQSALIEHIHELLVAERERQEELIADKVSPQ